MEILAGSNPRFIPVSVANLSLGMFVAELDRPWLETPFLFQGFEITDVDELSRLEEYCEYVFVDPGKSAITLTNLPRQTATSVKLRRPPRAANASSSMRLRKPAAPPPKTKPVALDPQAIASQRDALFRSLGSGKQETWRNNTSLAREAPAAVAAHDYARDAVSALVGALRHGKALEVAHFRAAIAPVTDSVLRNHDAMSWLVHIRKRQRKTYDRWISSAVWSAVFAKYLGLPKPLVEDTATGGLLLDIGTIHLSEHLRNGTGEFRRREKVAVRSHVRTGLELLRRLSGVTPRVMNMVAHHHERSDGSGYPDGLEEPRIPVHGRLAAIVDCYDAMISEKAYREAMSPFDAMRELKSLSGTHFQSELLDQFVQALGVFPSGCLVELNTGEVGLVVEQHPQHRLRPKLMMLLNSAKKPLSQPAPLDLATRSSAPSDPNAQWIDRGHRNGAFDIDTKALFPGGGP